MTWVLLQRVALFLLVAAVVVAFRNSDKAQERYDKTNAALCAFQADLQRRYDSGRQYLKDLDHGKREPIPGISRADITTSLNNQKSTLNTLVILDC